MRLLPRFAAVIAGALALVSPGSAEPLSKDYGINFFRDVPSRNLTGLATRSDGRLVVGPFTRSLAGEVGPDLLWDLATRNDGGWLVGTGPDGVILAIDLDAAAGTFTATEWSRVDSGQVFTLGMLPDGRVLAGTSPNGKLFLLGPDGATLATAALPADSIFDVLVLDDGTALAATGNPGRIYRIDLAAWLDATNSPAEPSAEGAPDAVAPANTVGAGNLPTGITEFGRVRDRNVRRLARLPDGRLIAGSAPDGILYAFPATGGAPQVLFEDNRAEITDITVTANGDVFAAVVSSGTAGTSRIIRSASINPEPDEDSGNEPEPAPMIINPTPPSAFSGRSSVLYLPGGDGLPETVVSRGSLAIYRVLQRADGQLLIAGGENGDLVGYDPRNRRSLTYAGTESAQITDLAALPDGSTLALLNNPAGLALIDFTGTGPRSARTRRLDLRDLGRIGAVRFNRQRDLTENDVHLSLRANRGNDEREGWTPWVDAVPEMGSWTAPGLLGRYAELRVEWDAGVPAAAELDNARIFHLPQNQRPVLQAFRVISPDFSLIERPAPNPSTTTTLGQIIGIPSPTTTTTGNTNAADAQRPANALLGSQVVPDPGMQIVTWTINDPDGDELAATFSLRRDDATDWIDIAVDTRASWVQFDRSTLPDGIYFSRLVVRELAPRPAAERFTVEFQADDLMVDRTPPRITRAEAIAGPEFITVTIAGVDELSVLAGADFVFNNGYTISLEQPADGIRDSQVETFTVEAARADLGRATSVEVQLHDTTGNRAARRLALP